MNKPVRICAQFFKRHAEALFIIAFILADCFLSGWALTAGTLLAVLYVAVPALMTIRKLDAVERLTYLKALARTQKVHRLAFLLFWIYSIRFLVGAASNASLFTSPVNGHLPSISSAIFMGAHEFAPLMFLASPFLIYLGACVIAILLRSRLKSTKSDPDLIAQRQKWTGAAHCLFISAFIASILCITLNTKGPAYMMSNWLLASARDANLFTDIGPSPKSFVVDPAFAPLISSTPTSTFELLTSPEEGLEYAPMLAGVDDQGTLNTEKFVRDFDTFIIAAFSTALFILFLQPITRLHSLFTSFCWRVVSFRSLQNMIEAFIEALRLPSRTLGLKEERPFLNNAGRTLIWLFACYFGLFWLFGFCGGPLGMAIQNWMTASAADAGFLLPDAGSGIPVAPDWIFSANFRIFLGSIAALYATAPVAVMACVFLPYAKPRRFVLNADGITFAQGPYLPLWCRQFRLWSDLKRMSVRKLDTQKSQTGTGSARVSRPVAKFTLEFRTGGRIVFDNTQVTPQDLRVLLDAIDQHAGACEVDPEIFTVCQSLIDSDTVRAATDGIDGNAIRNIPVQDLKSTIFVPFAPGEFLPGTKTRVIKQLVSKPLCAVYLAREEDGRMVTVKQFYLAEETDETRALKNMLAREYELLSRLDHPGIARVVNFFTAEQSTYLVIEHRLGDDLREIVLEHGPRSQSLTIAWAKQLCEIMIYLHNHEPSIIHRDLTPDNVIAGGDGQLRLIDFGAAREFLEGITGTMLGKHCYVSPEQLRGEANQLSDIYSFGGMLHFLLTGRDPVALSQSSPATHIDCSEELDRLIRDCTEFDEQKRPQSFELVLNRLKSLERGFKLKVPSAKAEAAV